MRNTLGQKLDGLNKIIKTEGNKELFNSILIESTEIIKDHIDSKKYKMKNAGSLFRVFFFR